MRLTFVGKGGAGKTSLAGLVCWSLAERGERVLAVDADSVPGLAQVLGIDAGDRWFLCDAAVRKSDGPGWDLTMTAVEAIERYAIEGPRGIRFLQMGNVGSGQLTDTELAGFVAFGKMIPDFDEPDGWVVADTLGGTMHASAGWTGGAGAVVVVVEPFAKSMMTAARLAGLSTWQPGVRLIGVGSKISTPAQREWLQSQLSDLGIPLWAEIPADPAVSEAERQGIPLVQLPPESPAMAVARSLVDRLRSELQPGGLAGAERAAS